MHRSATTGISLAGATRTLPNRKLPGSFDGTWRDRDGEGRPPFDQDLADSFVGKYILVGITHLSHAGDELRRQQLHGVVERASPDGILISLRGVHDGESWNMPPLLEAIRDADPGIYALRTTDEKIEDPDLLATWQVREPQKH